VWLGVLVQAMELVMGSLPLVRELMEMGWLNAKPDSVVL
jgi:hypothetical protein